MKKPILMSTWFDRHDDISRYSDFSIVWNHSARKHVNADNFCLAVEPPDFTKKCPVFYRGKRKIGPSKTLSWLKKIDIWEDFISQHPNRLALLCDVDIAFYGDPFKEVLDFDFDVAICGHNTGAVYFRGNKKSREFMREWYFKNHYLVDKPDIYQEYDKKYKGLDQASLGYIMENGYSSANIAQLPRRFHSIWNDYEDPCYLMHYHSRMKTAVFDESKKKILPIAVRKYQERWVEYFKEAKGASDRNNPRHA